MGRIFLSVHEKAVFIFIICSTNDRGDILQGSLSNTLHLHKGKSILFFASLGNTITSAIDNINMSMKWFKNKLLLIVNMGRNSKYAS